MRLLIALSPVVAGLVAVTAFGWWPGTDKADALDEAKKACHDYLAAYFDAPDQAASTALFRSALEHARRAGQADSRLALMEKNMKAVVASAEGREEPDGFIPDIAAQNMQTDCEAVSDGSMAEHLGK